MAEDRKREAKFDEGVKKIVCPTCGHFIGTATEKWSARNCPRCGLLVFKHIMYLLVNLLVKRAKGNKEIQLIGYKV